MRIYNYIFITLVLLLSSCETFEEDAPFKKFTIKAGKHSSVVRRTNLETPYLSYDIFFDETAEYYTKDPRNQMDINKLFGFSDCNSLHHQNSIRFGWNWNGEAIDIYGYHYLDGKLNWKYLGTVEINKVYRYNIYLFEDLIEMEIEGITANKVQFNRHNLICEIGYYYQLFPYFGGDETAPHDINIYFKRNHKPPMYVK